VTRCKRWKGASMQRWILWIWIGCIRRFANCYEDVFRETDWQEEVPKEWYANLPNVVVLDPEMETSSMQEKIIEVQNATSHFGAERYAILLKPGVYSDRLRFNPGYYTSIIGVGSAPEDVSISDMWVSNDVTGHATNNFWRSLEGVTITAPRTMWAVSQASPLRRSVIGGELWLSHEVGYSSGGFISDVKIGKSLVMGTQQQWFARQMTMPPGGLKCWQGWNYIFMGVEGIDVEMGYKCNKGTPDKVSIMDRTARSAEKPYIVWEGSEWMIHVPKVVHQPAPGYIQDRKSHIGWKLSFREVFVANPEMSSEKILQGMRYKAALLLTPGIYTLTRPLEVTKDRFVVLGIGFPTLVSPVGQSCLKVRSGLTDVRIASIIFDANTPVSHGYAEPLLQWGDATKLFVRQEVSGVASDIVARIGAFAYLNCELKRADNMLEFNDDSLIIDNVWVWHADHDDCSNFVMAKGADMMDHHFKSDQCQSQHGVVVNGNNVVAYGVAVEHIDAGHMLLWNGEAGQLYFFQAELPYHSDLTLQQRYAAYAVDRNIYSHFALGLGVYIIGGKPAYAAYLLSEYCDLRNVVTVVIDASDDSFHHQVCQESMEGEQTCYKPQNCSWSRCWRPWVPYVDAHALKLRGASWPRIPPTEKLPEPKILQRLTREDRYQVSSWQYADYQLGRGKKGVTREAVEASTSWTSWTRSWIGQLPWLALVLMIAANFGYFLCFGGRTRQPSEADLILRGYGDGTESMDDSRDVERLQMGTASR